MDRPGSHVTKRYRSALAGWDGIFADHRDKEATRDAVRSTIFDFLYSDKTGLPDTYNEEEIKSKADDIFQHVFYAYPTVPSPVYGETPR